ncbi:hypothetical protein LXT21_44065 [Myxococcus sp. K38C18041901]|uniref:hypothetical protein n=1 Tax=Myxococcus guangdongensis TaxID=2906760 RepID=UPI0020A74A76|nr:hypothetical protein [Myxococcus guangdongensis]MCP3065765.1 hypothetical protein [Myxococcus guangdongensis]
MDERTPQEVWLPLASMGDNHSTISSLWSNTMLRVALTAVATLVVMSCSDSACRSTTAAPSVPPMPDGPLAGQAQPPCRGTAELPQLELRGACWVQVQAPKGAAKGIVELEGKFYAPAAQDHAPNG